MDDCYTKDRNQLAEIFTQLKSDFDALQIERGEFLIECKFYEETEPPRIDVALVIYKKEWMKKRESRWISPLSALSKPLIEVVEKMTTSEIQVVADIIGRRLGNLSYKRLKLTYWSKWVIYVNWVKKDGKPQTWK